MLFTEHFKITRTSVDDWFDPILNHDTKLFIDPFLVFQLKHVDFKDSHQKVVNYFNYVFELIAKSSGNQSSTHYKKALNILLFPEAKELCLGYASGSTLGAGSGYGFSKVIADAIWESIKAGITHIDHFEELSIFNEGIGADRISDMTANLLRADFVSYTKTVCARHQIPLVSKQVHNAFYDFDTNTWLTSVIDLPLNPFSGIHITLVPTTFIRPLPMINPNDFWDYVCSRENEILRSNFSYHLKSKVNKKDIVELARANLQVVKRYVDFREQRGAELYDLQKDPDSYYQWYSRGKEYAASNKLDFSPPTTPEELFTIVKQIVEKFKNYIEMGRGYEVLWAEGRPRAEKVSQRVFAGVAKPYCEFTDIDISKEVNLGAGPVDFKFSRGLSKRALIEVKLASNSKFWNGLTAQLPEYMRTEEITDGLFMVVVYSLKDLRRYNHIQRLESEVNKQNGFNIEIELIDARPRKSASKL